MCPINHASELCFDSFLVHAFSLLKNRKTKLTHLFSLNQEAHNKSYKLLFRGLPYRILYFEFDATLRNWKSVGAINYV